MENIDDVWAFVEKKIKSPVPAFIKNILKVCGYDNIITIASIEEDDVKYFEQEVRNGSVEKYFEGANEINLLDGSTKSVENFEFTRGHKQFLMFITDLLKNYLKENGPDSIMLEVPLKTKSYKDAALKSSNGQTLTDNLKPPYKNLNELKNRDMKIHQGILTCKVYAENMELINAKIANDLVKIQMKVKNSESDNMSKGKLSTSILYALICCPFCSTQIDGLHKPTEINKFLWNISNFNGHLELAHLNQTENIESNTNDGQVEDLDLLETTVQEKKDNRENNCIKNCTLKSRPKQSIVCYSDANAEDEELQSYSKILIASSFGSLTFEQNKIIPTSFETSNSKYFPKNHDKELTKELHGYDQKNELISPQLGNYVICSLFVKDTIQWPAKSNIKKNFVGKICGMKDNVKNIKTIEEEIDIHLLNQCRYSTFKFMYPENTETSRISRSRIVKILEDPSQNRRGELVFKDKSILDYVF